MIRHRGRAEALQRDVEIDVFAAVPVDGEEGQRPPVLVVDGRNVEVGHVVGDLGVIAGALDTQLQGMPAPIARGEIIGIVDRLPPGRAVRFGHDRRDHVDELRDAGDPHNVRPADESVEDANDLERVLENVSVLEQPRRMRPPLGAGENLSVLGVRVVPDIPFVEGNGDLLAAALDGADEIDGRGAGALL